MSLTVLSGPAGVGKSSVVARVRRDHPRIWVSVSATTRPPRPGEVDGVDRVFLSDDEFQRQMAAGELFVPVHYAGHWYATPKRAVDDKLAAGVPVLMEIDLNGAREIAVLRPEARRVFLAPPSWAELERRLRGRGTEDAEVIARRLAVAREELAAEAEFDETIVNSSIEEATDRLVALMAE